MDNYFISPWEDVFYIHWKDCGPDGNASIMALFNYLQESAWNHANHLGLGYTSLTNTKQAWVLLRFRIEMDHYPNWQNRIRMITWPRKLSGPYAFREFRIMDSKNKQLGTATSTWIIINTESRRPVKPKVGKAYEDILDNTMATSKDAEKIEFPGEHDQAIIHEVSYSELDMNGHVNSTNYLQWTYDMIPHKTLINKQLKNCTINFLGEGKMAEEILILMKAESKEQYLFCGNDNKAGRNIFCTRLIYA